jgi:hypothetical protein
MVSRSFVESPQGLPYIESRSHVKPISTCDKPDGNFMTQRFALQWFRGTNPTLLRRRTIANGALLVEVW